MMARSVRRNGKARSGNGSLQEKPTGEEEEKMQGQCKGGRSFCWEDSQQRKEEKPGVCLSCSRESSTSYQFCFPLRLVFGVSCFAAEFILRKRIECRGDQRSLGVLGEGLRESLCFRHVHILQFKTRNILQMSSVCFICVNLCFCNGVL